MTSPRARARAPIPNPATVQEATTSHKFPCPWRKSSPFLKKIPAPMVEPMMMTMADK